jgi:hypothetical protein
MLFLYMSLDALQESAGCEKGEGQCWVRGRDERG